MDRITLLGVFGLVAHVYCAFIGHEVFVQINLRRPINVISDKYVSFSIDPAILMSMINGSNSDHTERMVSQLTPAYLKLTGTSLFAISDSLGNDGINQTQKEVSEEILRSFNQWMKEIQWKPIIPLPYSPKDWDTRRTLHILNTSRSLGVDDCIWQLGTEFEETTSTAYVADLKTLHTMVNVFNQHACHWRVIGADINAESSPDEIRLYTELSKNYVKSVGWIPSPPQISPEYHTSIFYEREMSLRSILHSDTPVWLNLPNRIGPMDPLQDGLDWAKALGDVAQSGFNVIFKPLEKEEIFKPTLSFYVSQMFQKVMGRKVFDTKSIGEERHTSHVYCHCSKHIPGALTLMGINTATHPSKIITKIIAQYLGPDVWEHIFTMNNDTILYNDGIIDIDSPIEPLIRIRKPNDPIILTLPASSVGFWIFPQMNVPECYENQIVKRHIFEDEGDFVAQTSGDVLLQQLIKEALALRDQETSQQTKREESSNDQELDESNRKKRFVVTKDDIVSELIDLKLYETANKLRHSISRELIRNFGLLTLPPTRFRRQAPDFFGNAPLRPPGPLAAMFPKLAKGGLLGLRTHTPGILKQAQKPLMRGLRAGIPDSKNRPLLAAQSPINKALIPQTQDTEHKIFESRENFNLPNGDVYAKLAKGPNQDYDYVEFHENTQKAQRQRNFDAPDDESLANVPNTFHESYNIKRVEPMRKSYSDGEIYEHLHKSDQKIQKTSPPKQLPQDQNVGYVMRELEPTWNQNREQLRKAQQDLRTYYMQPVDPNDSFLNRYALAAGQSRDYVGYPEQSEEDEFSYAPNPSGKVGGNTNAKRISSSSRKPRSINQKSLHNHFQNNHKTGKNIGKTRRTRSLLSTTERPNRDNAIPRRISDPEQYIPIIQTPPKSNGKIKGITQVGIPAKPNQEISPIKEATKGSASGHGSSKLDPKHVKTISQSFDHLVELVNHHVNGWWNTWQ